MFKMSSIFRNIVASFLLIASAAAGPAVFDEVTDGLARAEALYYEARFAESIETLRRVQELLSPQPGRLPEKTALKRQLAIAYVGLNDNAQAKSHFRELFELDPDHPIDPEQFSPKVVTLAEAARAEQNEIRCRKAARETQTLLDERDAEAARQILVSNNGKCPSLAAIAREAAEMFFRDGLEAYKKGELADAVPKFRAAIQLQPQHEMASQYLELASTKLLVDADRALLDWRRNFEARAFEAAAADYRRLASVASRETMDVVHRDYRKALEGLQEPWNRACAAGDDRAMDDLRRQAAAMSPAPAVGGDLIAKMVCRNTGCVQMDGPVAMARLRKRVNPEISQVMRSFIQNNPVTVRVVVRINDAGDVTVRSVQGGNVVFDDAARAAVVQWKFLPAVIDGEARCVDTEFSVLFSGTTSNAPTR